MPDNKNKKTPNVERIKAIDGVLGVCKKYDLTINSLAILMAAAAREGQSLPEMIAGTCNADYKLAHVTADAMTVKGKDQSRQPGKHPTLEKHYAKNRTNITQPIPVTLTAHGKKIVKEIMAAMES